MSLRVWLPLNGNINNQGLDEVTTTSLSSVGFSDFGKIGKSLNVTTDGMGVSLQSYMNTCSKFSTYTMCAWIYMNSAATNHSSTILSSGDWNQATKQCCFGVYNYNSGYTSILIPNKSSWQKNITVNEKIKLNTWYHICITYDGSVTKAYVDGKYVGSSEFGGITSDSNTSDLYIGRATYYTGFTLHGNINDVRIYDHCLSTKEVKELSKGLCLHYKLSRGGENLAQNTSNVSAVSLNKNAGGNLNQTRSDTDDRTIHVKVTTAATTGSNAGYYFIFPCPITNGKKYTGSYKIKFNKDMPVSLLGWENPNMRTSSTLLANTWYTFSKSATASADRTTCVITVYSNYTNWTVDTEFWLTDLKVEEGDHETPWIPNKSDTLYSQLGYNNIEPDCSGYGNNGTITGALTYSNDTPRYLGSSYLTNSESCIKIGDLSKISSSGIFTFNIWFKKITNIWSSKTWETILGGPSGFELETKLSSTTNNYIHPYSWGGGSTSTPNSYSIPYNLDTWNMLTMVRTSSETKFYLNGELKVTGTTGTIPSGNYFIGAWKDEISQNYRGYLSDARIYATALSADDIKALYNTPISIDDKNTLHCTEIIE